MPWLIHILFANALVTITAFVFLWVTRDKYGWLRLLLSIQYASVLEKAAAFNGYLLGAVIESVLWPISVPYRLNTIKKRGYWFNPDMVKDTLTQPRE